MSHRDNLPIEKVLSRLQQVKPKPSNLSHKQGLNQWQALCPAHADKTPSLTITECLDDTVLIKCWAGCTANEIVHALGLELKDLFKPRVSIHGRINGEKPYKKQPSQKAILHERLIIQMAETLLNKGLSLSQGDQQRYQLALQRLKTVSS